MFCLARRRRVSLRLSIWLCDRYSLFGARVVVAFILAVCLALLCARLSLNPTQVAVAAAAAVAAAVAAAGLLLCTRACARYLFVY